GPAPAGQFFAAIRLNEMILEAATVAGVVLFSNAARQDKGASILARNARISCWMFWLFMGIAVLVVLGAPYFVNALVGEEYAAAAPALQIMALCMAPTAASKIIYQTLSGSGNAKFGTPVIIASLAINFALALILVPSLGVMGGAVALVIGRYGLFAGYVASCRLRYGISFRDMLVPRKRDAQRVWRGILSRILRKRQQ
ncbi:lipopolysaccharide biosynthesis protein, partial [Mycobacterium sp. ZZG]